MKFPLIGNERIKSAIEAIIASGRFPHAIIIEGDIGTGKRTLARFLAKAAVCEANNIPCDNCRNCHLADAGTHPDIEIIAPEEKKKNITVEQIRNLRTTAYLSPHTSKRRIFIIEQADTMNISSQNSLLKVLEEPPGDVLFILLTVSAERLLETVVSRCISFSLFPPQNEPAFEYLTKERSIPPDVAEKLLKSENGNIGKVITEYNNSSSDLGRTTAHTFFEAIEGNSLLDALLITVPLEKDRLEAGRFTEELCDILMQKIKQSFKMTHTARKYANMYDAVCLMRPTLDTNINLALYFSVLTSKLTAARNKA